MPQTQDSRRPKHYTKSFFGVAACEGCGSEFPKRRNKSRFCSEVCRKRHDNPTPGFFGPSVCVFCGSSYEKIRRDQQCCSAACSQKKACIETGKKRAVARAESHKAVCLNCSKDYCGNRSDQSFCSASCRSRHRSVFYVPAKPSPRPCIVCGKVFEAVRSTKICSIECKIVRIRELADRLTPEQAAARAERRRFYTGKRWRELRARMLALHPHCTSKWCRGLHTPSAVVHHIKERLERPDLAYDPTNLQSLCAACHSRIHKTDRWRQSVKRR